MEITRNSHTQKKAHSKLVSVRSCEKVFLFSFVLTWKGSLNWVEEKSCQGTKKKKSHTIYKMLDKMSERNEWEIKWKEKGEKLIILR